MRHATEMDEIVIVVHDTGIAWVEQTVRAARARVSYQSVSDFADITALRSAAWAPEGW